MVEYSLNIDNIFGSLADPTRRDILRRVSQRQLTVGELVKNYDMSFAAVSKHLRVLEKSRLINKRKEGRKYMVSLNSEALREADEYFKQYRDMWESRFNKLDKLLKEGE